MARLIGLAAIFGMLPIGEAISLWDGAIGGYFLAGAIAVAAYLCYGARFPSSKEFHSQLIVPLLLLVAWAIISLAWCPADAIDESRRRIISLALIAIQLHIIFTFVKTKYTCAYIAVIYALSITCVIGGTILGLTPWECINREGRISISIHDGHYLNENNIGNQAATAVIFMLYLFSSYKGLLPKITTIAVGLIAFGILFASGSRGALLGLTFSLLLSIVYYGKVILKSPQKRKIATLILLLLVLGTIPFIDKLDDLTSNTTMAQRFNSTKLNQGINGRLEVIFGGINYVFAEGNILGKGGAGAFRYYSEHYRQDLVVHCMPVAMLADFGIVGLLLYGFTFWQIYKSIKTMPNGNEKALCVVLSIFMVLVTSKCGGAYCSGWTWCILGLITTIGYRMQSNSSKEKKPARLHFNARMPQSVPEHQPQKSKRRLQKNTAVSISRSQ